MGKAPRQICDGEFALLHHIRSPVACERGSADFRLSTSSPNVAPFFGSVRVGADDAGRPDCGCRGILAPVASAAKGRAGAVVFDQK